tara:strand:+ start:1703 stop:2095 length:393 start_codon:yes stop_codon:yes gene_type:complete
LPVFDAAAVPKLQKRLYELETLMPIDVPISSVNMWHKANRWIYDLARMPAILDYVEDLIGPDSFSGTAVSLSSIPARAILCPGIKIRSIGRCRRGKRSLRRWPFMTGRATTAPCRCCAVAIVWDKSLTMM